MIFLLQYDRKQGKVRKLERFSFAERAKAQRKRLDIELSLHKVRVPYEVVLLEAADERALKRTHQRYFKTPRELVEAMSPA
jgi:hypothetical protein